MLQFPQGGPAISHNRTAISEPGRKIELSWKDQGTVVGPYNTTTYVGAKVETNATSPLWAAFIMQLNVTYVPIEVSNGTYGTTIQPNATVFETTPNNQVRIAVSKAQMAPNKGQADIWIVPLRLDRQWHVLYRGCVQPPSRHTVQHFAPPGLRRRRPGHLSGFIGALSSCAGLLALVTPSFSDLKC